MFFANLLNFIFAKLSIVDVCGDPGYASRFSDVFKRATKGSIGRNGLQQKDTVQKLNKDFCVKYKNSIVKQNARKLHYNFETSAL